MSDWLQLQLQYIFPCTVYSCVHKTKFPQTVCTWCVPWDATLSTNKNSPIKVEKPDQFHTIFWKFWNLQLHFSPEHWASTATKFVEYSYGIHSKNGCNWRIITGIQRISFKRMHLFISSTPNISRMHECCFCMPVLFSKILCMVMNIVDKYHNIHKRNISEECVRFAENQRHCCLVNYPEEHFLSLLSCKNTQDI